MTNQTELPFTVPTRNDEIVKAFAKFHRENPKVFTLFEKLAQKVIDRGFEKYSARTMIHVLRWHVEVETTGDTVKINNNFSPYYGRLYELKHPERAGLFQRRHLISSDRPASGQPMTARSGAPADFEEAALADFLRGLLEEAE